MRHLLLVLLLATSSPLTFAQDRPVRPTVDPATSGLQPIPWFVPLHWDARSGKLLMEVPPLETELLYQITLATGVGSNPIGLDRGQLGSTQIVRFQRSGPRVLLVASNYRFRAISPSAAEQLAV